MNAAGKILVYGFGNPGRQDDGLGTAFAECVEEWKNANRLDFINTDCNYQLNIEDALLISEYDVVVFADATVEENVEAFLFEKLDPAKAEIRYTLHAASPAYILQLCHDMYKRYPDTSLMRIKGYEWDVKEGLTDKASENLKKAVNHFIDYCSRQRK